MADEANETAPVIREGRANLVITVGLAALITSLSGMVTEMARESHDRRTQQCDLAQKVVAEPPTDLLVSEAARRHLALGAYQRLDACLRS